MGYSGLEHYNDSDLAAGAVSSVVSATVKALKKALKEKGNTYNTEGAVNVALYFETFMLPLRKEFASVWDDDLTKLALKVEKKLGKTIEEIRQWPNSENKSMHLEAYLRMRKNMKKFLAAQNEV
jgi:hypothetical protein